MDHVTVLMPIGPKPGHLKWINEALDSIFKQTRPIKEIMLIDDQAHLSSQWIWDTFDIFDESLHFMGTDHHSKEVWVWDSSFTNRETYLSLWKTPWRLGFAAAFNCGMALAMNELVVYLASDDFLYPDCVADCLETYHANQEKDAWYALSYDVQDEPGVHTIPNNCAMITRGLWEFTGGFPPSAFAGPDALLLSCLIANAPDRIIPVKSGKANYFCRKHDDQDTHSQASFFLDEMNAIRNKETERFSPEPEWAQRVR